MLQVSVQDREKLIDPMFRAGLRYWLIVGALLIVVGWGVYMYVQQVRLGLGQTGMQRPVFWGMYMTNFIFFIGISHAGTLISAILRVTGAEWRRPITRIAEAITVFALIVGTLQIIIDMGRPDRLYFTITNGRLQSPILWDVVSVTVYFLGSIFYLYLPLMPDLAIVRDNLPPGAPAWRRVFYRTLALGWRGNAEQWHRLEKAISFMAIFIIPVAVSVHTIISWILATTVQPGWHSTVFGPYFVVGAIFSGIAALFLVMTGVRKALGLEDYIKLKQYRNLGLLFLAMNVVWAYFTYAENLTLIAAQQEVEFPVLASKLWGEFAFSFWSMIILMIFAFMVMVVPRLLPRLSMRVTSSAIRYGVGFGVASLLVFGFTNPDISPGTVTASINTAEGETIGWILAGLSIGALAIGLFSWLKENVIAIMVVAGVAVLIGMWLERWNIIVPTMTHPRLIPYGTYTPSMTEIALTSGSIALFLLFIMIFFKLFPAISIWEIAEGRIVEAANEKISIPLPDSSRQEPRHRRWKFR